MPNEDEFIDPSDDGYRPQREIDEGLVRSALCDLHLLGDDLYLGMQATNLGMVDAFATDLEYQVLQKLYDEERTPGPEAAFLLAISQMWIFAAYELLRTWRARARDFIKWSETGGLEMKLRSLERDAGTRHIGREIRADQIRAVIANPDLIRTIKDDMRRTHILFARLEAIRISLAKHEVAGRAKSVALAPGYARINRDCGSLDFELENGIYSMGYISRRDVADSIRALADRGVLPSDDELAEFDSYMRGPPPMST